jgi:hypothetical protein
MSIDLGPIYTHMDSSEILVFAEQTFGKISYITMTWYPINFDV